MAGDTQWTAAGWAVAIPATGQTATAATSPLLSLSTSPSLPPSLSLSLSGCKMKTRSRVLGIKIFVRRNIPLDKESFFKKFPNFCPDLINIDRSSGGYSVGLPSGIPTKWLEAVGNSDRITVRRSFRRLGLLFSSFRCHIRRPVRRSLFRSAFSVGKKQNF